MAFRAEIEHVLTPHLFPNTRPAQPLKLDQLAIAAQNLLPQAVVNSVYYVDSSGTAIVEFSPLVNPVTGKPYQLDTNQLVLNAVTGDKLAERARKREGLPTGMDDLMLFIYRLHFNLSLGPNGRFVLGIIALLWTIDCFVAFYLTLPASRKSRNTVRQVNAEKRHPFLQRWKPAWLVKWRASSIRINFDLHRAGGLWLWLLLLVFAWSSVAFNLKKEVYDPVMRVFFDMPGQPAKILKPANATPLDWSQALLVGERLMQEQSVLHNFTIEGPVALTRQAESGVYAYRVKSSLDVQIKGGMTFVYFDMYNGQLQRIGLPTTQYSGQTVYSWLRALHDANVFGLPYRILVCMLGLVIVMLSVTGVIIWLKKRRARALVTDIRAKT